MIDVIHAAAEGFLCHGLLRLALGADEQDGLAEGGLFTDVLQRLLEVLQGLLQVDDVDVVTFAEDELLHPRIPVPGLVPEMNAGFEQFLHSDLRHGTSVDGCARVNGDLQQAAPNDQGLPSRIWPRTLWKLTRSPTSASSIGTACERRACRTSCARVCADRVSGSRPS